MIKLFLIFIMMMLIVSCVPSHNYVEKKTYNDGLIRLHCIDGVMYMSYFGGTSLNVKYDKNTLQPELCDN